MGERRACLLWWWSERTRWGLQAPFPQHPCYKRGRAGYQLWNCAGAGSFVGAAQPGSTFNLNNAGVAGNYSIVATCGVCQQRPPCMATANSHMPVQGGGTATAKEQLNKRLNGYEGQDIQVMPNPNSGKFQVSITRAFELGSATLFDAQGRRVAHPMRLVQGPNNMDFGDLKPGVYTLRTEVDGKVSSHNVVIADE